MKKINIYLKFLLDFVVVFWYSNLAPVWAQSAMMREIAVKTGNFRGVCPS